MTSYRILDKLARALPAEEHGVRMRVSNFFFYEKLTALPEQLKKMKEIESVSDVLNSSIAIHPHLLMIHPDSGIRIRSGFLGETHH
jgi:hypothetical protein